MSLLSYGCSSSAGLGVEKFWSSLQNGVHHAQMAVVEGWPVLPSPIPNIYAWNKDIKKNGAREALVSQLLLSWQEACKSLTNQKEEIFKSLGVIFASTKGEVEDFIWGPLRGEPLCGEPISKMDPFTPVLEAFIQRAELKPKKSLCVSNACASSHAALFLAKKWMAAKSVNYVLVIAADFIGPFVVNGFQSLRALSKTTVKPFSGDRDGLLLGDAAVALLLTSDISQGPFIEEIFIDNEGYAITRPSQEGESLERIYAKMSLSKSNTPDLVIAHGTGTLANDQTEDQVLSKIFPHETPPVTATKWCIGHTLGASGAMDLIAAAEILKHQKIFSIGNTTHADKNFRMPYLCQRQSQAWNSAKNSERPLKRILINSLGFGGAHAALLLSSEIS